MGELTRKIRQPAILGEIFAGILLGPTVLGHFRPRWYSWIFPTTGALPTVLETVTTLGVVFFLLVAGLETSFASYFPSRQKRAVCEFFWRYFPICQRIYRCPFSSPFSGAAAQSKLANICSLRWNCTFDICSSCDRQDPDGHRVARATDREGNIQPAMDDWQIAKKRTYWESNGQITRTVRI